ncbi:MAG: Glu/Leu/Phe/Val dehydrogenase [Thermodesulfobacteriota bacterium]
MNDHNKFSDRLGPFKVIHIHEPSVRLRAIVVVDNVACGPAIGGVRMAPDVSLDEAFRLARAMTLKNSAAGLSHGGGKAVIAADPKMEQADKEELLRAFACAIRDLHEYIPGPDMGTDELAMAWTLDEIGRAVGLPREIGGIPLDEIGATAWGLTHCVDEALAYCDFELAGARVVVQGFGSVGKNVARFLVRRGAMVVGAADSRGAIAADDGLDVERLIAIKEEGGCLCDLTGARCLDREAVLGLAADIWIPAARPDVITMANVDQLQAKLVVPGANIPMGPAVEKILHDRGVLVVPDFIANAGGVICAAAEYQGESQGAAFADIEEKIRTNTREVLAEMASQDILPRQAATNIAMQRLEVAMACRRWRIF